MDILISKLLNFRPERLTASSDQCVQIPFLLWLLQLHRPDVFVELGTQSGNLYFSACQFLKQEKMPTRCHAVGTWQAEAFVTDQPEDAMARLTAFHDERYADFSRLLVMGGDEAVSQVADATVDLLWLDAHQSADALRHALACWRPKLSARGVLVINGIGEAGTGAFEVWPMLSGRHDHAALMAHQGIGVLMIGEAVPAETRAALRSVCHEDIRLLFQSIAQAMAAARREAFLEARVRQLDETLSRRQVEVNDLKAKHQAEGERNRHLQARLEEARTETEALRTAHDALLHHSAGQHIDNEAMRNSLCWKITAPIRWVGTPIQQTRKKAAAIRQTIAAAGGVVNTAQLAMKVFQREGVAGIRRRLGNAEHLAAAHAANVHQGLIKPGEDPYHAWLRHYDPTDAEAMRALAGRIESLGLKTTFSVVMPVYNPPLDYLRQAIESVQAQVYPHWEICIADDASPRQEVRDLLNELSAADPRIKLVFREKNGHISAATNSALQIATGDFIALMDNDDLLPPHALAYMALAVHQHPEAGLIYSDEDKVTEDNVRMSPYFKCQFNYELFLSQNMISHFGVYRRSVLEDIGGFRVGYEGAQDWDLALRVIEKVGVQNVVHVPRVLYHWRVFPGSTALALEEKDYALKAQLKSIGSHLERIGKTDTEVFPARGIPGLLRIRHALPPSRPLVSIVIPTRDRVELLSMCVDSILAKTVYQNYEIVIVDNGSTDPKALEYLAGLAERQNIRVLKADIPFNYSRLNNLGVAQTRGEYLVLMNNDIEITQPDWIEEMLAFAAQPDIGCVGAQLWYPDGTLQHGGVVLGIGGVASHAHKGIPRGNFGYFGRASAHQMFSAVTAACLMVRKSTYQEAGGLDETLEVAYNDIDFCLKVRARGYRNLYNPFAQFVHHESASRGSDLEGSRRQRLQAEAGIMKQRWAELIGDDPAYSPNLTLAGDDFSWAWPSRVKPYQASHC
ncbi:MAG: glycosyltransferase [Lautropia sp.]|nr:glycosyltransferase [Lautropia sp.]